MMGSKLTVLDLTVQTISMSPGRFGLTPDLGMRAIDHALQRGLALPVIDLRENDGRIEIDVETTGFNKEQEKLEDQKSWVEAILEDVLQEEAADTFRRWAGKPLSYLASVVEYDPASAEIEIYLGRFSLDRRDLTSMVASLKALKAVRSAVPSRDGERITVTPSAAKQCDQLRVKIVDILAHRLIATAAAVNA